MQCVDRVPNSTRPLLLLATATVAEIRDRTGSGTGARSGDSGSSTSMRGPFLVPV